MSCKILKIINFWQKMKKSRVQLALNQFFGWFWVPGNPILGTRSVTTTTYWLTTTPTCCNGCFKDKKVWFWYFECVEISLKGCNIVINYDKCHKKTLKQQFCTSRPSPDLESPNAGNTLGSNGHLFKTKKTLYLIFTYKNKVVLCTHFYQSIRLLCWYMDLWQSRCWQICLKQDSLLRKFATWTLTMRESNKIFK